MSYADIVIKSSAIFTAETLDTIEGAVVINGREIEAVCSADEAVSFIGPDTRVIEAGGNMVLPGFNDSHTHFLQNGIMNDADFTLNLEGITEKEEALAKIAEFAAAHPENEWIVGCGFNYDSWDEKPTRQMLDEIVPDRPVYIASWDMHVGWMSTLALQAAGYTNDTPDPEGGYLGRDADGHLTGLGFEPPVNDPVWGMGNLTADMDRCFGGSMQECLSFGVTSAGVVWPYGGVPEEDHMRIFKEFEDAGKLPMRLTVFPEMEPGLAAAKRYERELRSEHLRFGGVKQIVDGVCEAHTGFLTEPYADDPSTCGEPTIKKDELKAMVAEANGLNYPVRLHAIGNGTVRMVLDVFEEVAQEQGFKGLRNCIEHIESCSPEDINRFVRLSVIPSMQPIHSVLNVDGYPQLLGEKWVPYMWPVKSIMETGAIPAFGTDAPVWNFNPMEGIYAAVTRQQPWDGMPAGGFVPGQRITVAQALQAYTYGSARSESFENRIGTLHAGKLADVVVMDRNLLTSTPEEILKAKPLFTIIDGKVVYEA